MELEVPRVWLRLSVHLQPDGRLAVGVVDNRGRSVQPPPPERRAYGWEDVRVPLAAPLGPGQLLVRRPAALTDMLRTAVDSLPTSRTGTSHPPVVSIHVVAPAKLALIPKADLVAHLVAPSSNSAGRWVVLEDRPAGPTVAPFALPLDVVAIGDRGTDVLEDVRAGPWMSQDEQMQAYLAGIEWFAEPASVVARLAEREIDLLVLDASDAHTLDRLLGRRARFRVRVAVVLGIGDGGMLDAIGPRLRFARSVLTVKGPPDAGQLQVLRSFLIALSHDLPLHDALILTRTANPARGIELSASPVSLHDLRLTSAWAAVEQSLTELSGSVGRGTPDLLTQRITDLLPAADHASGATW